jgi:ribosome-binding protein aMBF1 (putative translation factor)
LEFISAVPHKTLAWLHGEIKSSEEAMDAAKKRRLKAAGWRFGTVTEFLNLSKEEEAFIEIRLRLSDLVKDTRKRKKISQLQLAKKLGSSQSRVAKIEAGDSTVSLDLLMRASLVSGATRKDLARAIATPYHYPRSV